MANPIPKNTPPSNKDFEIITYPTYKKETIIENYAEPGSDSLAKRVQKFPYTDFKKMLENLINFSEAADKSKGSLPVDCLNENASEINDEFTKLLVNDLSINALSCEKLAAAIILHEHKLKPEIYRSCFNAVSRNQESLENLHTAKELFTDGVNLCKAKKYADAKHRLELALTMFKNNDAAAAKKCEQLLANLPKV